MEESEAPDTLTLVRRLTVNLRRSLDDFLCGFSLNGVL